MVPDEYQMRHVLRRLAKEYPASIEITVFADLDTPEGHRALFYMAEKQFVEPVQVSERPGQSREMLEARITAKGLDWLEKGTETPAAANDTAFVESEALRQFLVQSINASALSREIKEGTRTRLLAFSREDLKALYRRLLQAIAERPELIAQIILGGVPK